MRDVAFTTFLCLAVAGCSDADVEKLRVVGDRTYDRAANVVQQTWEELGRTLLDQKPVPTEPDLLTKVQQRLKWERELHALPIVASVHGEEVILTGVVKTKEQKERAIKIAETTQGVTQVQDQLEIALEQELAKP